MVNIDQDIIEVNVYCNNKIAGMSFIVDIYGDVEIEFIKEIFSDTPIYWSEVRNSIKLNN